MADAPSLTGWLCEQIQADRHLALDAGISGRWRVSDFPMNECAIESTDPVSSFQIYDEGGHTRRQAEHIVRWDPAAVLADLDAKLALLRMLEAMPHPGPGATSCGTLTGSSSMCDCGRDESVQAAIHHLAAPYADRPGYRDEWRPE